jgi:hypothetical protein
LPRARLAQSGRSRRKSLSSRCVSAAKQHPHRPGLAPAPGLRAGAAGRVLIPQTRSSNRRPERCGSPLEVTDGRSCARAGSCRGSKKPFPVRKWLMSLSVDNLFNRSYGEQGASVRVNLTRIGPSRDRNNRWNPGCFGLNHLRAHRNSAYLPRSHRPPALTGTRCLRLLLEFLRQLRAVWRRRGPRGARGLRRHPFRAGCRGYRVVGIREAGDTESPAKVGHHASRAGALLDALDEGHRRAGEEVRPVPPAELAQALG